jgi:hypothetical protein
VRQGFTEQNQNGGRPSHANPYITADAGQAKPYRIIQHSLAMKYLIVLCAVCQFVATDSFSVTSLSSYHGRPTPFITSSNHLVSSTRRYLSSSSSLPQDTNDDSEIQWELFKKHHALGSWKGIWTTVDYMGDVLDETVASVDLVLQQGIVADGSSNNDDCIQQTHTIAVGATRSDCQTCFDSENLKTIPVAIYTKNQLYKQRFAACGMVNGPTLLKSKTMATELVLHYADARVRVVFQHAPVWERGLDPNQGPPQGLKVFRVMYSREALRNTAPTAESEAVTANDGSSVLFYRPVSPFEWHKQWNGTSWTWGPQIGNRGWALEELDEADAWHGNAPVSEWNLRLPGGIFIQCPRVITDASVGLCRLAWMPNAETLLRLEAGVSALQPMVLEDETVIGFEPPTLASLRCDVLQKVGDLDGEPQFSQMSQRDVPTVSQVTSPSTDATVKDEERKEATSLPIQRIDPPAQKDTAKTAPTIDSTDITNPRDVLRL